MSKSTKAPKNGDVRIDPKWGKEIFVDGIGWIEEELLALRLGGLPRSK
jgi:hypothetical protein